MPAEDPRPRGVFVTGTDTGVGKTLVACALARFLSDRGLRVAVIKPVESGVADPRVPGPDAELLRWAARCDLPDEDLAPCRLHQPLAPAVAAEREHVRIDPGSLSDAIGRAVASHDFTIVEGAGGLMVPLAGGYLVADLARDAALPLLTVCRSGLGTINHTLLTLFAARTMNLSPAGFIINSMPASPDAAEESAPHTLASLASADLLGVFDQVQGTEREKVAALVEQLRSLPTLPWLLSALGIPEG